MRAGDLDRDAAPLLRLLREQLSASIDQNRFDWLYRKCPQGEAKVWVALETESGRLIGAAAVFPRKIHSADSAGTGFVLGDFCVSVDQRSLGLAIQLQKKCLENVQSGAFSTGYDLPSRNMLAVYRRLGVREGGLFNRMVKLLRSDEKVAQKVKAKRVAKILSGAANAALTITSGSLKLRSGASVELQRGRCGEEFSELARDVGNKLGTCVERSAEYLNWRYLDHPQQKFEILAARHGGRLVGYVILAHEGSSTTMMDLFSAEAAEIRKDLVRTAVALSKSRGSESVQASILTSHPYHGELKTLGFRSRESSPVIFFGGAKDKAGNHHWLLMDGDRES